VGCGVTFTGVRSLAATLSNNQNIKGLGLCNNQITVDGAHLIMKSAVKNGVCEDVYIDNKYEDDEVKKMMTILKTRSRQNVRNYIVW